MKTENVYNFWLDQLKLLLSFNIMWSHWDIVNKLTLLSAALSNDYQEITHHDDLMFDVNFLNYLVYGCWMFCSSGSRVCMITKRTNTYLKGTHCWLNPTPEQLLSNQQ